MQLMHQKEVARANRGGNDGSSNGGHGFKNHLEPDGSEYAEPDRQRIRTVSAWKAVHVGSEGEREKEIERGEKHRTTLVRRGRRWPIEAVGGVRAWCRPIGSLTLRGGGDATRRRGRRRRGISSLSDATRWLSWPPGGEKCAGRAATVEQGRPPLFFVSHFLKTMMNIKAGSGFSGSGFASFTISN